MDVDIRRYLEAEIREVIDDCGKRGILNSSVTIANIYEIVKKVKNSESKKINADDDIESIICDIINEYGKRDVLGANVIAKILDDVKKIFHD